jgi:hypothetical protein
MNGEAEQETDPKACRLAALSAAMARTRERTRCGRGQLACVLANAGIGDWRHTPRYIRAVALVSRLCQERRALDAFRRLVLLADARAGRLLHRPSSTGQYGYLLAMYALASHDWQRPPERWQPVGKNAAAQFAHLARWLLGMGEATRFLETRARPSEADQFARWLSLPLSLTRRMVHCFLAASGHYDAIRALRWGQVMALGGGPALARLIALSPLGAQLWPPPDEAWWRSVVHWFVNHPVEPDDVTPILDYICAQRYGDSALDQPPDPRFSVKGRGYAALLQRLEARASAAAARTTGERHEFAPCGARPGRWDLGEGPKRSVWTITEILDSVALREEAWQMRHCAARYGKWIRKGQCSLWSMMVRRGGVSRRAVTIEMHYSSREIVESRGRANRRARPEELEILRLWAAENGLRLNCREG